MRGDSAEGGPHRVNYSSTNMSHIYIRELFNDGCSMGHHSEVNPEDQGRMAATKCGVF